MTHYRPIDTIIAAGVLAVLGTVLFLSPRIAPLLDRGPKITECRLVTMAMPGDKYLWQVMRGECDWQGNGAEWVSEVRRINSWSRGHVPVAGERFVGLVVLQSRPETICKRVSLEAARGAGDTPLLPDAVAVARPLSSPSRGGSPRQVGIASWYRRPHSRPTAASRDFPRHTWVKVTAVDTGRTVTVFIDDYGPEAWTGRSIDLSLTAFRQLADPDRGLITVRMEGVK